MWAAKGAAAKSNHFEDNIQVEILANDREYVDNEIQDSNSSTSSGSSTILRKVKSAAELSVRKINNGTRKFKHHPYKASSNKPRSKRSPREKNLKLLAYEDQCDPNHRTLEVTPDSSTEYVPRDCYKIREVGKVDCQDPFICSLYITSYNAFEDQLNMQLTVDPFADTLANIASGKIKIQKTSCGIIVAFTAEDDADKVIKLPLQKVFGGQVQVARFQTGEYKFRQNAVITEIPWCISNVEIHEALKKQGIGVSRVIRTNNHVKIEVLTALDMYRLIGEGLNFFNCTSFPTAVENNTSHGDPDIIQCFKCQGFWHTSTHCRQIPRCVRCGENHDVEYCPRPRNAAVCCHCGGPHHAAYKLCPVRLQHINSTYVAFQLSKGRPAKPYMNNIF